MTRQPYILKFTVHKKILIDFKELKPSIKPKKRYIKR